MNLKTLVLMFLFEGFQHQSEAYVALEKCGIGAYEFAHELEDYADELVKDFDPARPVTDLLYIDCYSVSAALYKFMQENSYMPASFNLCWSGPNETE
uniref:Uncharacterized protein n=1 Tax=Klebsiella phage vB-Kvc-Y10 TaxID=3236922 RepID=A0AB39CBX1_9CAUD